MSHKLKENYSPTPQEALVDPIILKDIYDFYKGKRSPSITLILEMFTLAEALVLFDRLISPSEWRVQRGLEKTDFSYLGNLSKTITFKENLNWFSVDYGIPNDDAFDYAMNFCFALDKRFSLKWKQLGALPGGKDFSLEISDTLNIFHRSWKWRCEFVASPLWEMFFVSEERPLSIQPKGLYEKLSVDFKKEIDKLQAMRYPTLLYIPPIPAVALQKCNGDISRFWTEVENIRKEFSDCRKKYANYQKVIANPHDKSLGELIQKRREAIFEVETELSRLSGKRTDNRILMEIWDSVVEVDIGGNVGSIELSTGANIKNILSKSFKWLRGWIIRGRARSLFNIYKKTISIRGYDRLIDNNFKVPSEKIKRQTQLLSVYLKEVAKATNTSPSDDWSG